MSLPIIRSPTTQRDDRLPPGHELAASLPVRHVGQVPHIPPEEWDLALFPVPLVDRVQRISWNALASMPRVRLLADMHGHGGWSRLDILWEGVPTRELLRHVRPADQARFVMLHAEFGYTANLPIESFFADDALLAIGLDGLPLPSEHGGPVRAVIPGMPAWKSVKWIRGIEFMADDRPGYWELPEHGSRGNRP